MSAIKTFSFIQPSGYRADCCKSTAAAKYYLQLFVIARLIKFQESKATISLKPKNDQCVSDSFIVKRCLILHINLTDF